MTIVALSCGWIALASAANVVSYQQGGVVDPNTPSYGWWYGCTATSAGMMMAYYDQKGYDGLKYDNLVPGGVAEASTVHGDPNWNALAKNVIASQEHVNDYYRYWNGTAWVPDSNYGYTAYGGYYDDVATPTHANNCLADFMGTSQFAAGNTNGSTTLHFWPTGDKFTAQDAYDNGVWYKDGMYGMDEYFRYAGYGTGNITKDEFFYNQYIDAIAPNGCTFAQYQDLIDSGLVVMIQVTGHSMFGYGYTDDGQIIFDDTWGHHDATMYWNGTYSYGDYTGTLLGITVFTPSGGSPVPLPGAVWLLGTGLLGLGAVGYRRRKKG